MMSSRLFTIIVLASLLFTVTSLWLKLDFFGLRNRRGRTAFLWGTALVVLALFWQYLSLSPSYSDWFVPRAYGIADYLQTLSLISGIVLLGLGIVRHDRFWLDSRHRLEDRDRKLSILENLQHDARQPYQLLELLDIALREIVTSVPGASGAVFLANRTRRQFVLTASIGLAKDEIAALEHYPLEKNIVSQAVELGEALIAPGFDFVSRTGETRSSRFQSVLVLPLIAGGERIGGLLLFAEQVRRFDRDDARYLAPVVEWLAERVRSARLQRELSIVRTDRDRVSVELQALHDRLGGAVSALAAPDPLGAFCRALSGAFGSSEVHLCSIAGGKLDFLAGSARMGDLSESYKTALIEAVDRQRPLLINQESSDEQGRDKIVAATLVSSLDGEHATEAILFRRTSSGMTVDDPSLRTLEVVARLAGLAIDYVRVHRRALSQRAGLDRIVGFLSTDPSSVPVSAEKFIDIIAPAFPEATAFLVFGRESDGRWRVRHAVHVSERSVSGLAIGTGEGAFGRAAVDNGCAVAAGREEVTRALEEYQPLNRQTLDRLLGSDLIRALFAVCPLRSAIATEIVAVLSSDIGDRDSEEYGRLLTLACGLFTFRAALESHQAAIERIEESTPSAGVSVPGIEPSSGSDIPSTVTSALTELRISGDLYMVGGRPREIRTHVQPVSQAATPVSAFRRMFEQMVARFSALAAEDEVITLSIYQDDTYVYLDVSRHRRFFSPVTSVAGFGAYRSITDGSDGLTGGFVPVTAADTGVWLAVDSSSSAPTYLSLRFLRRIGGTAPASESAVGEASVLVIDDQAVILDLVSAMCQTMGYRADVARSGEVGLKLASERNYALVLVDLAMPGLSGLEVARELRRRKPGMAVVIMTGWEASLDRAALTDAGVMDVLYKPFRIEQLGDLLQSAVKTG
jgi:CheY-like chemotaxis protein/putative methionine-R-sulfoxide reductase with GAF domain